MPLYPILPKPTQKQSLDNLLFSNSNYDEEEDYHRNHYEQKLTKNNDFLLQQEQDDYIDQDQDDDEKFNFPTVNAPSVQFSQNSMMMSKRYDEESRIEKNYRNTKILKEQEQQKNIFKLETQINDLEYQVEKKELEIDKLNGLINGYEVKMKKKQEQIIQLEERVQELYDEKASIDAEKSELYKRLNSKDHLFTEYKNELKVYVKDAGEKDLIIKKLQQQNIELNEHIQTLKRNLSVYTNNDRQLMDFGSMTQQRLRVSSYSMQNSNKNEQSMFMRELQQVKKDLIMIQQQNQLLKHEISNKEKNMKVLQETWNKKLGQKERKLKQMQEKLNEQSENVIKLRQKYEENEKRLKEELNKKYKEYKEVKDNQMELQRRVKNFIEEIHKKQEKLKDINIELIEKNKMINDLKKQLEELKIKQEFDHHIIKEKQEQMEGLNVNIEQLKKQLREWEMRQETQKTTSSRQVVEKEREREKELVRAKKQTEKYKKQLQQLRYEYELVLKQNQQQEDIKNKQSQERQTMIKDYKKKYDELNKKFTQVKGRTSELEGKNEQLSKLVEEYSAHIREIQEENRELCLEIEGLEKDLEGLSRVNEELEIENKEKDNQLKSKMTGTIEVKKLSEQNKKLMEINKKMELERNQHLNKLKIFQNKFKESAQHQKHSYAEEEDMRGRMQALQALVLSKQQKIKQLQNKRSIREIDRQYNNESIDYLDTSSAIHSHSILQQQIYEREEEIERLQNILMQKDEMIGELKEEIEKKESEIEFREKSLDFMHKKLVVAERQKMEIEAEKKMLEESFYNSGQDSQEEEMKTAAYKKQIKNLEKQLNLLKNKLFEKDQQMAKLQQQINNPENTSQYKFEIRELKKRVKQLSQLAISKERKLTPQSLSQEDTVEFLVKTIKRVIKSDNMIEMLSKSEQFREGIKRVDKVIEKFLKKFY